MASYSQSKTIYFGYGSNLWRQQMTLRCPDSTYVGIGRLSNYRWLINERGYANVAELKTNSSTLGSGRENYECEVYGLIYSLTKSDEAALDKNEGVPHAYTKETISIDFWPTSSSNSSNKIDVTKKPEKRNMLVYIDRLRTKDSKPKKEYIYRMNQGIDDALAAGVPIGYVDRVLRKAIPPLDEEGERKSLEAMAKKQAVEFEDENFE